MANEVPEGWKQFTRRTDDPKLAYLEGMLSERGIPHRRIGWSFHAPIMAVPAERFDEAYDLLVGPWDEASLDEVDDSDPFFEESFNSGESVPHDFDGQTRTPPTVGD